MDPELQALAVQLTGSAVRNSARAITERIGTLKAKKQDQETIAELEQIINDLIADKSEILRIAQAYQEELVAQRISDEDVQYVTVNILPVLRTLAQSSASTDGGAGVEQTMKLLEPILSVETITILQVLGFNFRKAVGQPLTELLSNLITSRVQSSGENAAELQKLSAQRELAIFELARDPDAYQRFLKLTGQDA